MALLTLLSACSPQPADSDRDRHAAALALLAADPTAAAARCASITDPALGEDCRWAAVEALAPADAAAAAALCEGMSDGEDECWFLLAEGSGEVRWCQRAGDFRFDCQLHLLTRLLRELPAGAPPAELVTLAVDRIREVGMDPSMPQIWSAVFRSALSYQHPLDRPSCLEIGDPRLQSICLDTAIQVFHDRLNRARDTNRSVCEGPLPGSAAYLPDEELDRVLAERRAGDLCRPEARRPPPPGAP